MEYTGICFEGLKESMCSEFGIGLSKTAAFGVPAVKQVAKTTGLDIAKNVFTIGSIASGLSGIGAITYSQLKEKQKPLYQQIADPNTALGGSVRTGAGIGVALLAASFLNQASRNRQDAYLV